MSNLTAQYGLIAQYGMVTLLTLFLSFGLVGILYHRFSVHLLDIPNHRSAHTQPTPRGGGLGFILAFAFTSPLLLFIFPGKIIHPQQLCQVATILLPLAIIGYLDDRHNISAVVRYAVQFFAASLAVYYFGSFPPFELFPMEPLGHIFALSLTIFSFTALVNFTNFMDGLDGLVAGVGVVQFSFLALYLNQPIWGLLTAALLGFLWWNWSPAKIFMGDVGSTILGAAVATSLLNAPSQSWSALAITLPLVGDAVYTIARRLLRRENIFQAHRFHLYQRLHQSGWSHRQVAVAYIVLTAVIAGLVFEFQHWGALASLGVVVIALAAGERTTLHRNQQKHCPVPLNRE